MSGSDNRWERIVRDLNERAKELSCLYRVEEILKGSEKTGETELATVFARIIEAIPPGWQFPQLCQVRIEQEGAVFASAGYQQSEWRQSAGIMVEDRRVGAIEVSYRGLRPASGPVFLEEEQKLLETIADRVGHFLFDRRLRETVTAWEKAQAGLAAPSARQWEIVLDLLEKADRRLFYRVSRKMLNYLCWNGVEEARNILQIVGKKQQSDWSDPAVDSNRPAERKSLTLGHLSKLTFSIAARHLSDGEIFEQIQKWVTENRVGYLVKALENPDTSLNDIYDALSRYHHTEHEEVALTPYARQNLNVLLIQRLFTEQLEFVNVAKDHVDIDDFHQVLARTIFPQNSHGRLGGKSAGLFIASQILERHLPEGEGLMPVRVPKTWYVSSDALQTFLNYNDLEEILEQKFKPGAQIREEYPNIVQVFKNSHFPPEVANWLAAALDDLGEQPIIVRSSSLLEDRMGTAFSGKYKSLFLANRGDRSVRLAALMDAIAEVYASTFGPDPIEYRRERGLTVFHEEMAVMIQEVVGTRVGRYFLPEYSGVAFSNNEFRWSPRIRREDGLIRMVPGLGTRAVDRLSDDYPKLVAPGQPQVQVNATVDEVLHYAPRRIDLIDLEGNSFLTTGLPELLAECGREYPNVERIVSVHRDGHLTSPTRFNLDFGRDDLVATFEGVVARTPFVVTVRRILDLLREKLGTPVDIEFAVSGGRLHLLQCRPQSFAGREGPVAIPRNIPRDRVLFTASRHVTDGRLANITHLVYVDPDAYGSLKEADALRRVARTVGRLNSVLPKRQFILLGPGRWGSRGDIRLGVPVSYADINNCALLAEIARKRGNYVPDLSFGTHFFQDLVESSIHYLPLYPDEKQNLFNHEFLERAENILPRLLPDFTDMSGVVAVIDVPRESEGKSLRVLMSADTEEAVAFLEKAEQRPDVPVGEGEIREEYSAQHWRWRLDMAEHIAAQMEPERFGVAALYLIGSTKNATAGPDSDIDLLVHFRGSDEQRRELLAWLQGWSLCLAQINFQRTGRRSAGLLDVHLITDRDVAARTSFAVKIGAVTDAARPLPLGE